MKVAQNFLFVFLFIEGACGEWIDLRSIFENNCQETVFLSWNKTNLLNISCNYFFRRNVKFNSFYHCVRIEVPNFKEINMHKFLVLQYTPTIPCNTSNEVTVSYMWSKNLFFYALHVPLYKSSAIIINRVSYLWLRSKLIPFKIKVNIIFLLR